MDITRDKSNEKPVKKAPNRELDKFFVWLIILFIYLFLFTATGYITFYDQGFNHPEKKIERYQTILKEHYNIYSKNNTNVNFSEFQKDFEKVVYELIKTSAKEDGDQQGLASQSFNIVLGAVLAFLSATSTMIFQQRITGKREK